MTDKKDTREMFTGIFEKYEPSTTQPVGQKLISAKFVAEKVELSLGI